MGLFTVSVRFPAGCKTGCWKHAQYKIDDHTFRGKHIWKKNIIFFVEKFDFQNLGSKKKSKFLDQKNPKKSYEKSMKNRKFRNFENFEISKFSIFHWLFLRFFLENFLVEKFSKIFRTQIFKIKFLREKLIFFFQIFFHRKISLCIMQKWHLQLLEPMLASFGKDPVKKSMDFGGFRSYIYRYYLVKRFCKIDLW